MSNPTRKCECCAREIPEGRRGVFCSNACKHIWQLQRLPKIRCESVFDGESETKEFIKLGAGCYMRTNLQNQG